MWTQLQMRPFSKDKSLLEGENPFQKDKPVFQGEEVHYGNS